LIFQVGVAIIYLRILLVVMPQAPSACCMVELAAAPLLLDENDGGAVPGSVRISTGSRLNIGSNMRFIV
jgi:hypothetical protein